MGSTEVGDKTMRNEADLTAGNRDSERVARPGDRPGDRPDPVAPSDGLWDVTDVGAYLRVPVSSIYKMTARKAAVRIPHIRIGGSLRFRKADIDRWLTLLTTSNIEALSKMRQKGTKASHGHHSQATT
jgi:excisionase family DNA binding protein